MAIIYLCDITMAYRKMVGDEKNYGIISILIVWRFTFENKF